MNNRQEPIDKEIEEFMLQGNMDVFFRKFYEVFEITFDNYILIKIKKQLRKQILKVIFDELGKESVEKIKPKLKEILV